MSIPEQPKRVLVTGGAGFIGYHLCRRLLLDGYLVTCLDGMTDYYDVSLKRRRLSMLREHNAFSAWICMIEDAPRLSEAYAAAEPDIVIHLAAQAGVRYSLENPGAYCQSNLVGTFNLLERIRFAPPRHFMLASTSSVYGANTAMPFREMDRADHPLTLYAATKKATEEMAHSYAHLWSIPTTAFRFFTVYGPWGRPDMALFKFVRAILAGEPIDVYGGGAMSRDFTYVDDLVEAIVRLIPLTPAVGRPVDPEIDSLSPAAPFRVVNIGGGRPVGLMDFIETIERHLGRPAIRNMLPMQPGDVRETFAKPDLLAALTGYVPATDVETGVKAFVDWYLAAQVRA
jgi:UDP-glucuronate 4-epimerase